MAGPAGGIAPPIKGLVFPGIVTQVISATQFRVAGLIGQGGNFFTLWYIYVVAKADGSATDPWHSYDACTGYVPDTGEFTITGLGITTSLSVGDEIYLMHPETVTSNIKGVIVYSGHGTPNWNSGVATSGEAGADVTPIGSASGEYIIHSLFLNIVALTAGAHVTVRMYTLIHAIEACVYRQTFVQGTDPDGLWIINGSLGISEILRVELYSDQAGDDGRLVYHEYMRQP